MIKFEISHSTQDINGEHYYHQNQVLFSSTEGQLVIPSLHRDQFLGFEINTNNKLIIISTQTFQVNGKECKDRSFASKNDTVKVDDLLFLIKDFSMSSPSDLKREVNNKTDLFIKNNHFLLGLLKKIKG